MEQDNIRDDQNADQDTSNIGQPLAATLPKQKSFSWGTEKKGLTSYSFVRNNETPQEERSNTATLISDDSSSGFIGHPSSQFANQYDRVGSNYMLNFQSPPTVFPSQMYPPQMSPVNPMYQSPSPNNLRIAFQDFQYGVDPSPTNAGYSQIDPSPTAETLIPSFIKDEIDSKVSNPTQKSKEAWPRGTYWISSFIFIYIWSWTQFLWQLKVSLNLRLHQQLKSEGLQIRKITS